MDFMKVLDQTVRDIKREVNLKVLKVPEIEQKVLDATSNEPWGPHGSALAELAQATKKFTECQMIMNALWTRLTDTGPNWRHVYKALSVIEYLVANGSERAVDDILEHSFQISSLSGFEYVEPNGKDVGINVRKKVETILALLNDKEKIQAVRNKATANRDKYFGLSSTGITYKSSSVSYGSGSSFQHSDRYGGLSGTREEETFKDSYKDKDQCAEETDWNCGNKDVHDKSKQSHADANDGAKTKKGIARLGKKEVSSASKQGLLPPKSSTAQVNGEDDFDDFDPRGSSTAGSVAPSSNQVDLFSGSLIDLMDDPAAPVPTETTSSNGAATPEVDLFADATFVSASPNTEATDFKGQGNVDLFANQPNCPASFSPNVDLFAASGSGLSTETKSSKSESMDTSTFDPFAAVPLNNFEGSDLFGAFTSHVDSSSSEHLQNSGNDSLSNLNQTTETMPKPMTKKVTFQVKSGIWADSLSRGLIDLNITAPKKVSLADVGIVGGLSDGTDEKDKAPPASVYMGRAMGSGSGLGRPGFPSSTGTGGSSAFSNLSQQQFGSFK